MPMYYLNAFCIEFYAAFAFLTQLSVPEAGNVEQEYLSPGNCYGHLWQCHYCRLAVCWGRSL